jgi:Uma2 family endonuclease
MNNAARLPDPRMDVATFLDWTREMDGRWELDRGIPLRMQSERAGHNRAKRRCANAMERAIDHAGLPCEVFADGMDVLLDDSLYVPDAMIRCGKAVDDDATRITDPVVVVEVLSPSNSLIEMTTKIDGYFSLPSVAWVLLLNTATRVMHSYARGEDALLMRRHAEGDTLTLDPPGVVLAVADLLPPSEDTAPEA